MKVLIFDNAEEAAEYISVEILRALARKPDLVLGLATGSSPLGVYSRLIRAHRDDGVSFAQVRTFNLDEYLGLTPKHPQSFERFMRTHLFDQLDIPAKNVHFPPTSGRALESQCARYEESITSVGGIDVQVLGIGSNGHIGFNEPTSSLVSRTRIKTLTRKTREDNARFYDDPQAQPQLAVTMGIGTILDAKRIFLQAYGVKKAAAVHAAIEGPISAFWPASALQMHPKTSFYLDSQSASLLRLVDYYRRVQQNDERREQDLDQPR